jgi:hypothetical protein
VLLESDIHRASILKVALKSKKPAGLFCASGSMSAYVKELLCAPNQTRRLAMMMANMMMVPERP